MWTRTLAVAALLAGSAMTMNIARAEPASADAAKRPVEIVSHRGESYDAPENSLSAVKLAWERGVDSVEFDVHLTADGELITIHDADTFRTTGGEEKGGTKLLVKDETAEALRKLDVGSWKGSQFAGERMPTIAEVLATAPKDPSRRFFIEVKVGPESVDALERALKEAKLPPEQTAVISFKLDTCREVKRRMPELKVYYLASYTVDKETGKPKKTLDDVIAEAKGAKLDGLDLSFKWPIDAAFVKRVKDEGLGMYVWTVDDPEVARRMVEAGVDGITTNRGLWLAQQLGLK